jgi:DMSO/TMAO reductase YedYZ molybdopterin-dependent catalytic subunit
MSYRGILILLFFAILSMGFLGFQPAHSAIVRAGVAELPSISLTVVGTDGTQVVLNETDVAELPSYKSYGGFKNQLGNVKGLGNYTGVSLNTLCDLVGGLTTMCIVNVSASDIPPYSSIFTFDEVVNGNFVTYDSNGDEVSHSQPLVPIVAYYFNDENISEPSGGPLRLAIVGPEGLVTNSTLWVKWAVRIEVIEVAIPEFPSPMVLPLFLLVASIVAFSLKVIRREHLSAKTFRELAGECGQ